MLKANEKLTQSLESAFTFAQSSLQRGQAKHSTHVYKVTAPIDVYFKIAIS